MVFKVLMYGLEEVIEFPFPFEIIRKGENGKSPDIVVADFKNLNPEEEKNILNFVKDKTIFVHIGNFDEKPFYSQHYYSFDWEIDGKKWFGLKVFHDLMLRKAEILKEGLEEFIDLFKEKKSGLFGIKSGNKRISFLLKDKKIIFLNQTENNFCIGNLLLSEVKNSNFNIDEIIKEQIGKGKPFGKILEERKIIDEKLLIDLLKLQVEKVAQEFAILKNKEYLFSPFEKDISLDFWGFENFLNFLKIFFKNLPEFPSKVPYFLLKDTIVKGEENFSIEDTSLSPSQFYLLSQTKEPIEVKKLFYILPGENREKERDLAFLYTASLVKIIKKGERLNPFQEVLKFAKDKEKMNFYEILGVKDDAKEDDIRKAYFELAKKYHPDKFSSYPEFFEHRKVLEDLFATINEAYQILSNLEERKKYDLQLKGEVKKELDLKEKARVLLQEARKAISLKQNQIAVQKLSEIVYLKEADFKVYQLLGKAYLEENKLKEAEHNLRKSLELDEKQYETHQLLGDLYMKAGLKQRAIKEYQRSLELNPANFELKDKLNELM